MQAEAVAGLDAVSQKQASFAGAPEDNAEMEATEDDAEMEAVSHDICEGSAYAAAVHEAVDDMVTTLDAALVTLTSAMTVLWTKCAAVTD